MCQGQIKFGKKTETRSAILPQNTITFCTRNLEHLFCWKIFYNLIIRKPAVWSCLEAVRGCIKAARDGTRLSRKPLLGPQTNSSRALETEKSFFVHKKSPRKVRALGVKLQWGSGIDFGFCSKSGAHLKEIDHVLHPGEEVAKTHPDEHGQKDPQG